jgi:hypothetical protein
MPDIAERSTDMGIVQNAAPARAAAQISAAFLWKIDMMASFWSAKLLAT